MSAETQAYARLTADAAVSAIVSQRVYPDFVPQEKTVPAIAITRVGTEPLMTIHSFVPCATQVTLEVWCLANGRYAAEQLANVAQSALAGGEFALVNRVPEYDAESDIWATVLTVEFWE